MPNASADTLGVKRGLRIAAWPHNWATSGAPITGHSTVYTSQYYPALAAFHGLKLEDDRGRTVDTELMGAFAMSVLAQLPKGDTLRTLSVMGGHAGGSKSGKHTLLIDGSVPYYSDTYKGGSLKQAHDLGGLGGLVVPFDPSGSDEVIRRWLWRAKNEEVSGKFARYDVAAVIANPTGTYQARFVAEDLMMLDLALARPDIGKTLGKGG